MTITQLGMLAAYKQASFADLQQRADNLVKKYENM